MRNWHIRFHRVLAFSMKLKKELPLSEWKIARERLDALVQTRKTARLEFSERNARLRNLLRLAREESGLTQAQVGRGLGRDQTFIAKIETGVRIASFVEVEELARVYRKTLSDFATLR